MFMALYCVQYFSAFLNHIQNFLICLFIHQLIFSILLQIHTSKASSLLLSACINVHVSAAYNATLLTRHFITHFFSSKFNLPVNSLFLSVNIFFLIAILLWSSYSQYPSSDMRLPRYLNSLTCSTNCMSIWIFNLQFPLRLMHIIFVFFTLIFMP